MKRFAWDCINDRIKHIPNPVGVEVGVHQGYFSKHMLASNPTLALYMVDAWSPDTYENKDDDAVGPESRRLYTQQCEKNYEIALKSVAQYQSAFLIKKFSQEAALDFQDNFFDFIFIDACHDEQSVTADIRAWLPKVKINGWLCGHDYHLDKFPGVTTAVDKCFYPIIIESDEDYTWFFRRTI